MEVWRKSVACKRRLLSSSLIVKPWGRGGPYAKALTFEISLVFSSLFCSVLVGLRIPEFIVFLPWFSGNFERTSLVLPYIVWVPLPFPFSPYKKKKTCKGIKKGRPFFRLPFFPAARSAKEKGSLIRF